MVAIKYFFLIINLTILIIQIYALIFVFPVEKRIYEECQYKILCELDKIDHPICETYKQLPKNITSVFE